MVAVAGVGKVHPATCWLLLAVCRRLACPIRNVRQTDLRTVLSSGELSK